MRSWSLLLLFFLAACASPAGVGIGSNYNWATGDATADGDAATLEGDSLVDTGAKPQDGSGDGKLTDAPLADVTADAVIVDVPACTGANCCASAQDCDDDDPCTTDDCDLASGDCIHAAVAGCGATNAPCDAKHPCQSGVCDGSAMACVQCLKSSDCGGSGIHCQNHKCIPGVACKSDVDCKAAEQVCAKQDGACVDCNVAGDCGAGKQCIDHLCHEAAPCSSSKDCKKVCDLEQAVCADCLTSDDCKSGEFCSSTHLCQPAICLAGACAGSAMFACKEDGSGYLSGQDCDDGNPCTDDICKSQGCSNKPHIGVCDDGNACTDSDACQGQACVGAAIECDDANPCTTDSCSPSVGCKHAAKSFGACDDGDACTSNETCTGGACLGTALDCNDANPCTDDGCNNQFGCTHVNNGASCNDGSVCTSNDQCNNGNCGGSAKNCDDANPCTTDSCDMATGCKHAANFGSCDDGNPCTSGEACSGGYCSYGQAKDCNDFNPCTTDSCSLGACQHSNNSSSCDDGDPCTVGDSCAAGACKPGTSAKACDDFNPCTNDACKAGIGCQSVANSAVCNDNNACTENDTCKNNTCAPGAAKVCDDKDGCTTDKCDLTKGCTATPDVSKCDDKNPCTTDSCASPSGTCGHAQIANCCIKNLECDDSSACTLDVCAGNACIHKNTCCAADLECSDGIACTTDTCGGGKCSSVALAADTTPSALSDFEASLDGWVASAPVGSYGWVQKTGKGSKTGQGAVVFGLVGADTFTAKTSATVSLTSAGLQLQPGLAYSLTFAYRIDVTPLANASLGVTVDMGSAGKWVLPTQTSTSASLWKTAVIDLSPIAGAVTPPKIVFTASVVGSSTATVASSGIWLDSVAVTPACQAQVCTTNSDCATTAPCASGTCMAGVCAWSATCCTAASQCDDKNACTTDSCTSGKCTHSTVAGCCLADSECDDKAPCTWDACGADKKCTHAALAECCSSNSQCDDADACSEDLCGLDNKCSHPALCCKVDADCNDGETKCTTDTCGSGKCVHAPTGAAGCCSPTLFSESFDGLAVTGWTLANSAGATKGWQKWAAATLTKSAPGVLYYGDPVAKNFVFSGANNGIATTPNILIPLGAKPTLKFWLYLNTEPGMSYDRLTVSALVAGVKTKLWDKTNASMQTWQEVSLPLTTAVGKTVQIVLDFETGDGVANDGLGVLIDDFRVLNTCP